MRREASVTENNDVSIIFANPYNPMHMIRCNNISLEYIAGKPVLRHVNLHLEAGSFTFVSGASGAGKSSLLSMLALCRCNQPRAHCSCSVRM